MRQITNANAQITYTGAYDPYGVVTQASGASQTSYGFTGEYTSQGLVYLRARYYAPGTGRFLTRDTWAGDSNSPMSLNRWNYGYGNPVKYTDPTGTKPHPPGGRTKPPKCPIGSGAAQWDCEAVRNVWALKSAFLDSASRHNLIPGMDNNGFAALIASVVVGERRLGNVPPMSDQRNRLIQILENRTAELGCVVSGHFILDAVKAGDVRQVWRYLTNQDRPQLTTVGIGNVWLYTATNIWNGQACSPALGGECTPLEVNSLQTTNIFGAKVDISNPFGPQVACAPGMGSACANYTPTEIESLVQLEHQLTSKKINIEYIAADLEAGARRAIAKGWRPSAFNSASWHLWGVQSDEEITRAGWNSCGANWTLDHIPYALASMNITSSWNLQMEPQYATSKSRFNCP